MTSRRGFVLGHGPDDNDENEGATLLPKHRNICASLPSEIDVFGFYFSIKHSLLIYLFTVLMFGLIGSKFNEDALKNSLQWHVLTSQLSRCIRSNCISFLHFYGKKIWKVQ